MSPDTTLPSQCGLVRQLPAARSFRPTRSMIPADLRSICTASIDLNRVETHRKQIVLHRRLLCSGFHCD